MPIPTTRKIAAVGLSVFNDVITRAAFARGLPVIDLRLIVDADQDYANDIEPSVDRRGQDRQGDRHAGDHPRFHATAL